MSAIPQPSFDFCSACIASLALAIPWWIFLSEPATYWLGERTRLTIFLLLNPQQVWSHNHIVFNNISLFQIMPSLPLDTLQDRPTDHPYSEKTSQSIQHFTHLLSACFPFYSLVSWCSAPQTPHFTQSDKNLKSIRSHHIQLPPFDDVHLVGPEIIKPVDDSSSHPPSYIPCTASCSGTLLLQYSCLWSLCQFVQQLMQERIPLRKSAVTKTYSRFLTDWRKHWHGWAAKCKW